VIASRRIVIIVWIAWLAFTGVVTAVLSRAVSQVDQVHIALTYLLLVLGASASGGRALGVTLAFLSSLLMDIYFQPPFGTFGMSKPLDLLTLAAFLVTALVATHLLARAQAEAREARNRTEEVSSLARLGSETLSAGRADDALAQIAAVIKMTLGMAECSIATFGRPADAEVYVLPSAEPLQRIVLPLSVQGRVVGVLRLNHDRPVVLSAAQRRFLDAITYYAALAVDRVALIAEAEHAEALREANRLKDIVLASVSHDLRTPLTTIKALAQSEAMHGNSSAAAIEEQADRLSRLVSDLLDLSRLKGGGFAVNLELNTAEDLIGATVRQARGLLGGRTLRTVVDLSSPALVGNFDFAQSLRIIGNLLENAVRYSPPDEPIELGAHREAAMLVFTVADRGPGVPPADVRQIFEPFYRGANASPDTGRTGLGLSIAQTLAEIQGGAVTYAPRTGGGSLFTLRLRATEVRADALEQTA
jgi:two-component system sensor histidine kinase KdpD